MCSKPALDGRYIDIYKPYTCSTELFVCALHGNMTIKMHNSREFLWLFVMNLVEWYFTMQCGVHKWKLSLKKNGTWNLESSRLVSQDEELKVPIYMQLVDASQRHLDSVSGSGFGILSQTNRKCTGDTSVGLLRASKTRNQQLSTLAISQGTNYDWCQA